MTELTKDNRWTMRWNGDSTVRALIRWAWESDKEIAQELCDNKWQADEFDMPSTSLSGESGALFLHYMTQFCKADLCPTEIWMSGKGENANFEVGLYQKNKLDGRLHHGTKGRFDEAIQYLQQANAT